MVGIFYLSNSQNVDYLVLVSIAAARSLRIRPFIKSNSKEKRKRSAISGVQSVLMYIQV